MEKYEVKEVKDLLKLDFDLIVMESKEGGFRFVERLINDYKNGINTFNKSGEALFGVFNEKGELVAIGGINQDPFSNRHIGRLRRFYVRKKYRRKGIGTLLVNRIINDAKINFKALVLNTDTEQANQFYVAIGFAKGNRFLNSSHFMDFK